MSKYYCKVENPSIDAVTGHHTVEVYIVEQAAEGQTINGVREKYGIDAHAIKFLFDGDVNKWLTFVAKEMLEKHLRRTSIHEELIAMDGKTIDL